MTSMHPQSRLIVLASMLVAAAWLALIALIGSMACGVLECSPSAEPLFLYAAAALVALCAVALVLVHSIKCPNCRSRMFTQTYEPKHGNVARYGMLDYWSSAVLDCLIRKKITCMYCGNRFLCNERDKPASISKRRVQ